MQNCEPMMYSLYGPKCSDKGPFVTAKYGRLTLYCQKKTNGKYSWKNSTNPMRNEARKVRADYLACMLHRKSPFKKLRQLGHLIVHAVAHIGQSVSRLGFPQKKQIFKLRLFMHIGQDYSPL